MTDPAGVAGSSQSEAKVWLDLQAEAEERERRAKERQQRMHIKVAESLADDELRDEIRDQLRQLPSLRVARQRCAGWLEEAISYRLQSLTLQLTAGCLQEALDNAEMIVRGHRAKDRVQVKRGERVEVVSGVYGKSHGASYQFLAKQLDQLLPLEQDTRHSRQVALRLARLQRYSKRMEQRFARTAIGSVERAQLNELCARELGLNVKQVIFYVEHPRMRLIAQRTVKTGKIVAKAIPPIVAGALADDLWEAGKRRWTERDSKEAIVKTAPTRHSADAVAVPKPTPNPDTLVEAAADQADDLIDRADHLRDAGKSDEAEELYRRAMQAGNTHAIWSLGHLLEFQQGREKDAESAYRQALQAGETESYIGLWRLLKNQPGREGETRQLVREAERVYRDKLSIGDHTAQFNLGFLLSHQEGREKDAEEECKKAIALGYKWSHVHLGNLLARQPGRERDAERAFRSYIPGPVEAYVYLGKLLARQQGRERDLRRLYAQAVRKHRGDSQLTTLKGLLET